MKGIRNKSIFFNVMFFTYFISLIILVVKFNIEEDRTIYLFVSCFIDAFAPTAISFIGVVIIQNIINMIKVKIDKFQYTLNTLYLLITYIVMYIINIYSNNIFWNIMIIIVTFIINLIAVMAVAELDIYLGVNDKNREKSNNLSGEKL